MSDPLSDFDPVPVVPLEYERPGTSACSTIVSWLCIVAAIFLGASLLFETAEALLSYTIANGRGNRIVGPMEGMVLYFALPILLHGVMLVGCLLCVRLNQAGWYWVVWGSIATLVIGLILLAITCASYASQFSVMSTTTRSFGPSYSYYLFSSVLTACLSYIRASFVPVMLLCLFFREEVRRTFRRSL